MAKESSWFFLFVMNGGVKGVVAFSASKSFLKAIGSFRSRMAPLPFDRPNGTWEASLRSFVGLLLLGLLWQPAWGAVTMEPAGWNGILFSGGLAGAVPLLVAGGALALIRWLRRRSSPGNAQQTTTEVRVARAPLGIALIILVVCLGVTASVASLIVNKLQYEAIARFQLEFDRAEAGLQRQLEVLMPTLRGVGALSAAGVQVGHLELERWSVANALDKELPGVLGLGIAGLQPPGSAQESVRLQGPVHLVPQEWRNVVAALPWSEPLLQATLMRAILNGRVAVSQALPMGDAGPVLLVVFPLYAQGETPPTQAARLREARQLVFALVRLEDFLAGVDAASQGLVAMELFDGLTEHQPRVYRSAAMADAPALFSEARHVLVGQKFFLLRIVSTSAFEATVDRNAVIYIALSGSLLSILFASVAWLLMVGRARALARAQELTQDLEKLALVAQRTSNAVLITDAQEKVTWVNEGFTRITGYLPEEVLGRGLDDLLAAGDLSQTLRETLRTAAARGEGCRLRVNNRAKLGREYWLDVEIQPQRDRHGRLLGFTAIETDITEQVQAEEALAREKDRAEGILLGSNVATWQHNFITGKTLVNDQWARMIGFETDEVGSDINAFWVARVKPEDLTRLNNLLDACQRGESLRYETDLRVQHKSGEWIWIMSRGVVLSHDGEGRPEWIAGIHMDVTAQRRTEEGLRDMQAFLYRSGRAAGVGAWEIDIRTQETKWSEQTCEIYAVEHGYRPKREEILAFYDADARQQLAAAMDQAPLTMLGWDLTLRMTDREGYEKWVRNVGEVEFDDSGPVRLVGALQDVSLLKESQARLEQTTTLLQSVLNSAVQVAVIATDMNRFITVFNKGAEAMLGYAADEVLHTEQASRFFAPEQLSAIQDLIAIEHGMAPDAQQVFEYVVSHPEVSEWIFVRKDDSRLTVSFLVSPMFDAGGSAIGYLGIAHDITSQKQHELILREAKVQAESASVAKSQFLANMSHEIRTPMNAILGMLRLLQNTPLSVQQKDYTQKTLGAAKSLLGLLNDILDFSKVEAGKLQLDPHPFLLEDLLTDMSVIFASNLGSKPLDLVFDIDPRLPPQLIGDALRIKQVLINLGGNAIKFTASGRVALVWRLVAIQGRWARMHIEIQDTGIGIAAENQSRIFEGFSQAESSTTRKYGGTGLGLAICQRMVRLLGSELRLQSELGEGSCFSFDLDLLIGDGVPGGDQQENLGDVHVLVVDDDPLSQYAIAQAVRANGWTATLADDAVQAVALLQTAGRESLPAVDLVLLDERMPDMDGWQLADQLHAMAQAGKSVPPSIMVGSLAREFLTQDHLARLACMQGHLVKPLTAGMVAAAARQALRAPATNSDVRPEAPSAVKRLSGLRLLIVEDNAINQQVARELLSAEGARVTLADNGQIGVDTLRSNPSGFDIVLMDLQMPVLDGLSAARVIRTELGLTDLPVIAMTANAMASDREDCLAAGMNAHVGKPFDLNDLVRTLRQYMTQAPSVVEKTPSASDAVAAPAVAAEPTVPTSEWVDVKGAIAAMGGYVDLYQSTLEAFIEEMAPLLPQLRAFILAQECEAARRHAHSFKGLSATVGAELLRQRAWDVETCLKVHPPGPDLPPAMDALEQEISRHLPELRRICAVLAGAPAPVGALSLDRPARTALQDLLHLLSAKDMRALESYAALSEQIDVSLRPALNALDAAISSLDFGQAEAECLQLLTLHKD